MQAARSAEGDQGKPARIVAALDRHHANGFLHGGVHDADDAGGKLVERQGRLLLLQPGGNEAARALEIKLEVAAEKTVGLKASKDEVSVGDGWESAATITNRTWVGAGGFRADA